VALITRRQGWRALITRPQEEADALVPALAARGVGALIAPMMQIHFLQAIPDLGGVQAVLCTSANGVRALSRACGERDVPLFAVGDATAARARHEGYTAVESAKGNSLDLAQFVARRLRPEDGRLLHACGSDVTGNLIGDLRERGFETERNVLYEARPTAALTALAAGALAARQIDFALFFSPRTAAIFTRLVDAAGVGGARETIVALSISAAADAALGGATWRARRVARRPDQVALLDLLDEVLAERVLG
jgi:uroporphyrinogen-III synthase